MFNSTIMNPNIALALASGYQEDLIAAANRTKTVAKFGQRTWSFGPVRTALGARLIQAGAWVSGYADTQAVSGRLAA